MGAPRIALIGGGRMATAMIGGLVAAGVTPARIVVSEPDVTRRSALEETYGVATATTMAAIEGAALVVLVVKPKHARAALSEIRGRLGSSTTLLSVVAGLRLATLEGGSGHGRVVRAIPNTPAQVGMSATVWVAGPAVPPEGRDLVRETLRSFGVELEVESEKDVEIATGVVGPAPAFVYSFIEAYTDSAVRLGMPRREALQMIVQSFRGSIELLARTGTHPVELRDQVTSPGGATAAGLQSLERAGFRSAVDDAIEAVYRRSLALGDD